MANTNPEGAATDAKGKGKAPAIDFKDPGFDPDEGQGEPWERLNDSLTAMRDVIRDHGKRAARDIVTDAKAYRKLDVNIRKGLNELNAFFGKWVRGADDEE